MTYINIENNTGSSPGMIRNVHSCASKLVLLLALVWSAAIGCDNAPLEPFPERLETLESQLSSLDPDGCCYATDGAGCEDTDCTFCVCKADPFCCDNAWDSHCVDNAAEECLDACGCKSGCTSPPGDINSSQATNILDVQCTLLAILSDLAGDAEAPDCTLGDVMIADVNCDGTLNVTDTQAIMIMALGLPLATALDDNQDGCPDACEYVVPDPCEGAEDGAWCDDGNRCTTNDTCIDQVCVGGPPPDCDDGNICTTDQCNKILGCRWFANSDPCVLATGTGTCEDKVCIIDNCAPNSWDLNTIGLDGCEYECQPAPSLTEVCINNKDDDCNGAIDEGCMGGCLDSEQPDDGLDEDCDGTELVNGTNPLSYLGKLPLDDSAFSVGLAGAFDFGPYGSLGSDGTMSRVVGGGPLTWCVNGSKPEQDFQTILLKDIDIEVCRDAAGGVAPTYTAVLEWEGETRNASGIFSYNDGGTVFVSMNDISLAPGISLEAVSLEISPAGNPAVIAGDIVIGSGDSALEGTISGLYAAEGTIEIPLTMKAGVTWTPIEALSLSFTEVTGVLRRANGEWDVDLETTAAEVQVAPSLTLFNAQVTALAPEGDGFWTLALEGGASVGPFENVVLVGSLFSNEENPLLGCFSGTGDEVINDISMNSVELEPCVGEDGSVTTSLTGEMTIEGLDAPFTGFLSMNSPWYLTATLPHLPLAPGITIDNALLIFQENKATTPLVGEIVLGSGVTAVTFIVDGPYEANDDFSLDLSLPNGQFWNPIPGFGMVVKSISGAIERTNSLTSLSAESTETSPSNQVEISDSFVVFSPVVTATVTAEGTAVISLDGNADVGPFGNLEVSGVAEADGTFCFESDTSLDNPLLVMTNTALTTCVDPQGNVTCDFETDAAVAGTNITCSGSASLDNPWVVELLVPTWDLSDDFALSDVKLSLVQGATKLKINGGFDVVAEGGTVEVRASGFYDADGPLSLPLSLKDGEVWTPFTTLDMEVTEIVGTLKKENNQVTYSFVSTNSVDVPLGDGLTMTDAVVLAESLPGGDTKVTLLGDINLGPLGEAEMEGIPTTNPEGETEGCFTQLTALSLGSILIQDVDLKVCIVGGQTTAISFSGDSVIDNELRVVTGTLTSDLTTATINLGTHLLGPGILMEDVVLTYVETSPFFQLIGTTSLGDEQSGLTVNLSGLYKNHGNAYLTPSIPPTETWNPVVDLPTLEFNSISGLITRISDVTEAEIIGQSETPVVISEGFTLTTPEARGVVTETGAWVVKLLGHTTLPFGEDEVVLFLKESDVYDGPTLTFEGEENDAITPLPSTVGDTHFILLGAEMEIDGVPGGEQTITVITDGKLCPRTGPCTLAQMNDVPLSGSTTLTGDFALTGIANTLVVPGFGTVAGANVFATWTSQEDVTVIAGVNRTLEKGVSFAAEATSPYPLTLDEDEIPFFFEMLSPTQLLVEGIHEDDWAATSAGELDSIAAITLSNPRLEGTIKGTALKIHLFGQSKVLPENEDIALTSAENIKFTIKGNALYTNSYHNGTWRGAMHWDTLGLQKPRLYVRFQKTGGIPKIQRVTTNTGGYWLRAGGNWPEDGVSLANADNVLKVSTQHAVYATSTTAMLCGLDPCQKINSFRTRVRITKPLTLEEAVALINDGTGAAASAGYADYLPVSTLEVPNITPVNMNLAGLTVEFSNTAINAEGVKWAPGLYVTLQTDIGGELGTLNGRLGDDGIGLTGTSEAFLLGDTQLAAYPNRQMLAPGNTGTLSLDLDGELDNQEFTAEAWVYQDQWESGAMPHVLLEQYDGSNGIRLGAGDKSGVNARLKIEMYSNGSKRTLLSNYRLLRSGVWNHIAYSIKGKQGTLFINGRRLRIKGSGSSKAAGATTATVHIGAGWEAVDDVRVWDGNVAETTIARSRLFPEGTPLAHFDMFHSADDSTVPNKGSAASGQLTGDATLAAQENFGETDLLLDLTEASPTEPMTLRAGSDWLLPVASVIAPSALETTLGSGSSTGTADFEDLTLVTFTNLGSLGLNGPGPDGLSGTTDDALNLDANVVQQTLAGAGQWTFEGDEGQTQDATSPVNVTYECPTSASCPLPPYGHALSASGILDISTNLPDAMGTFQLSGQGSYDSLTGTLNTSGALEVFSQDISAPVILTETDETTLTGELNLSPIVGFDFTSVELPLTLDHEALTLCGEGEGDSDVEGILGTFDAEVTACTGSTATLDYTGSGTLVDLLGQKLYSPVIFGDETGITLAGLAFIPGIFTGYLVGNYAGPADFNLSASTTLTLKGFKIYGADIAYTPSGLTASGNLIAGLSGTFAVSGPIVDGDPLLAGPGNLDIDGAQWLANLTTSDTLEVNGTLDIPPLNIPLSGALATPGNLVATGTGPATFITGNGGWYFPEVDVSMSSCIKATGLCAGVTTPNEEALGTMLVDIPGAEATLEAELGTTPLFFSTETDDGVFGTQTLIDPLWTFTEAEGLVISGSIEMPTGLVAVSGDIPPFGAYTLIATEQTALLNNPPLSGLVSLEVDLLGNATVGGPLIHSYEAVDLQSATWTKDDNDAFSFSGVRPSEGIFGERCEPDPSTKSCDTCTIEICDFECSSPFGTFCCASHIESYECNCTIEDYCDDLGQVECNVVVSGTGAGYDDLFNAICSVDDGPPFQEEVPKTTGNLCIYGGSVLGTQCVQLW